MSDRRFSDFVSRLTETWGTNGFATLFHPDGRIRTPIVHRPIPASEIAAAVGRTKELVPDIRFIVTDWAGRGDSLFIEWVTTATIAGERLEWQGFSRFALRGERAVEEVVAFDTLPLWERLDPTMKRSGLLEAGADAAPERT